MTSHGARDASETAAIAAEIRALRKGRGLRASDLGQRVGPRLRELTAAAGGDMAQARSMLAAELGNCSARLPDDLRAAIAASLGLSAATRHMPNFGDRVSWLAGESGRNYRTALRRIDAAEQLLAEEISRDMRMRRGRPAASPGDWRLEEFRAVLRLDTPAPESHEFRRIVAIRPGLTEVMAWLDVPPAPDQRRTGLEGEILYGGQLVRREEPSHSRVQFFIRLPAPLQAGESHDYELILRVAEGEQMRPHYIFTPECQCDAFDLRVRFDPGRLPSWVRRVDGETVRMFDHARPGGEEVRLDAAGEAHVRFTSPSMYLGYGLQWSVPAVSGHAPTSSAALPGEDRQHHNDRHDEHSAVRFHAVSRLLPPSLNTVKRDGLRISVRQRTRAKTCCRTGLDMSFSR